MDTGWIELELASGYSHDTGNYGQAQYRIIGNVIYFRGAITKNTGNFAVNAIFANIIENLPVMAIKENEYTGRNMRLPAAYGSTLTFLCIQVGVRTVAELRIDTIGTVTNTVYLAGISFPIN